MLNHPLDRFKLPAVAHYLPEKAAAELLGCSPRTLQTWRRTGVGPTWLRMGPRRICYRLDDIQAWADRNRHSSAA